MFEIGKIYLLENCPTLDSWTDELFEPNGEGYHKNPSLKFAYYKPFMFLKVIEEYQNIKYIKLLQEKSLGNLKIYFDYASWYCHKNFFYYGRKFIEVK